MGTPDPAATSHLPTDPGRPLHIMFTTQPASGHLRPLVPIAHAAQRRGHTVAVCSAPRLAAEVRSYGLPFLATGYDWSAEVLPLLPMEYFERESCDLFVTHGGLNSIKEAMRLGVPMVGVPVLEDHKHNMAACTRLGLARSVPPHGATVQTLRDACQAVLADPGYRRRARAFQRHMHVLPPVDDLVDDLEKLVQGDAS